MYLYETYKSYNASKYIIIITILLSSNLLFGLPADSIIVNAIHSEIKATSIYEIDFSIGQEISPKAVIVVTFPENFDLSGVLIAGSTTMNGGFELSVEKTKVILKRSGLGRTIKPNEKVDVKFANIRNPAKPADNYKIKVEIKDDNNRTIIEKEKNIKIISPLKK